MNTRGSAFRKKFNNNNQILRQIKRHRTNLKRAAFLLQLSTLLLFVTAIPVGNILGPIIVHFFYKDKYPELKNFYYEILNFQISFWLYMAFSTILCFIYIGFLLLPIFFAGWLILTIIGFIKIYNCNYNYKYPFTIKFFN